MPASGFLAVAATVAYFIVALVFPLISWVLFLATFPRTEREPTSRLKLIHSHNFTLGKFRQATRTHRTTADTQH